MKRIFYFLIAIVVFLQACDQDTGNYDYTEVNRLTVVDETGVPLTNKQYELNYVNTLKIAPQVDGSMDSFDPTQLTYAWVLERDTISKDSSLEVSGRELGTGSKRVVFIVTDKSTSGSYHYNFTINVSASIGKGSFILTEDADHQAYVTMKAATAGSSYLYFAQFNGVKLGSYPVGIELGYKSTSSTNRNYISLITATREGENAVIVTDLATMLPTMLYPRATAMFNGEPFAPTSLKISARNLQTNNQNGYVTVAGKVHQISKGMVGDDLYVKDAYDYNVGQGNFVASTSMDGYFVGLFDTKNDRIRLFGNNRNTTRPNVFDRDYDQLITPSMSAGHTYMGASEFYITDWTFQFLTNKDNKLNMHNIIMSTKAPYQPLTYQVMSSQAIPNLNEAVDFRFHAGLNFWYFALGRTLYRFSALGADIQAYAKLPEDGSGDIVSWNFDSNAASTFVKIGIATFNSDSPNSYKGSYYVYDIATSTFDIQDKYVINKAVGMQLGY